MRNIFYSVAAICICFTLSSLADTFFAGKFMTAAEAEKKWGLAEFNPSKFKSVSEKEKGAMAADAIKKNLFVNKEMLDVRKQMGDPDSYFFSDTIYTYKITEPGPDKESWQLIFVPDEKLKKVKEIKIHKKCCYKNPL